MLNWEEIVQKYIIKYSNQICKATRPLRDHFGIGYFTYHRIDHAGKYTVLVDRPDWAEHYVSSQIYHNDPYLRHPSVYQSGISLLDTYGSEEYKETVFKAGKKVLGMDMCAMLIHRNENDVEFFGFAGNKKNCALESIYLNSPQILASFAGYFKKKLNKILFQMGQEAGSLLDLKGPDFLCKQPIRPDINPSKLVGYYKDIGMMDNALRVEKLSSREKQCLKLLTEDKTAKEIAQVLSLSRRTIEYYLENIKNKLHCQSKQELALLARKLEPIIF